MKVPKRKRCKRFFKFIRDLPDELIYKIVETLTGVPSPLLTDLEIWKSGMKNTGIHYGYPPGWVSIDHLYDQFEHPERHCKNIIIFHTEFMMSANVNRN